MRKFLTLNKKHNKILKKYLSNIDAFIYEITETQPIRKWEMFQPLKSEAIRLHNELGKDIESESMIDSNIIGKTEWVFMLPNFLLFGCVGFATALKDENNSDDINMEIETLYTYVSETIIELDHMLCEHNKTKERKQTTTKTKQTK